MILVLLILIPLLAALLLFTGRLRRHCKRFSIAVSLLNLMLTLLAAYPLLIAGSGVNSIDLNLKQAFNVDIALHLDSVSLLLLFLTNLLTPIILASTDKREGKTHPFYALIFLMQMALTGVFIASEFILFYIFWELALIPIFFITATWGGANRKKITVKFLIYTIIGSFGMLVAILYLYTLTPAPHSFLFDSVLHIKLSYQVQLAVFAAFFLAFAIKIPLFPFHSWQAETYNVSPVQGTMLMAGIMLKMGLYGIYRFILPLCPDVVESSRLFIQPIIVFGVIYAAIIAINQPNLKKMIAFVSLSHVGVIALGLLSNTQIGIEGAIIQMFSHGVNVVGFLLCYYVIVKRTKTDCLSQLSGIARKAPLLATIFMVILLANIALPLTNSFTGEFLILLGIFQVNKIMALATGLTVILGAVYMLKMYQHLMLGATNETTESFTDLTKSEIILFVPILLCIVGVGIFPSFVLQMLETTIK